MNISVIIPTLNAQRSIGALIDTLLAQSIRCAEIIIIDSSSDDDTLSIAKQKGCSTIVIPRQEFNHGTTRNKAAEAAKGDVLIFMTQDAMPLDTYMLENLTSALKEREIAASFAKQTVDSNAMPVEKFARYFNYPDEYMVKAKEDIQRLGIKTFFFSNVCCAIKKDLFFRHGGFISTILNEDMTLAAKLILSGYKTAYQPKAKVVHYHNYTLNRQFKRYFDIGVSLVENDLLKHAKPTGEGRRFVIDGIRYFLVKEKDILWLGYFFAEAITKYFGYVAGIRYKYLPNMFRRLFSLHPVYFT
ncbi:glycosyl transferase family protein [Candidatus Magnetoovum chiemensis]|nr:glycosyl transferase family protein [Candidatus Magnetoovum chiemensis]